MVKPAKSVIRNLEKEKVAVATLLSHLGEIQASPDAGETDEALITDMIEGETDFFDALDQAAAFIALDEAHVAGIESMIEKLQGRATRKKARIELTRTAILNAMETAEQEKYEGAVATISAGKKPVSLMVIDESLIPSEFFTIPETPPPALDKRALLAKLKERTEAIEKAVKAAAALPDDERAAAFAKIAADNPTIPGAELSNGGLKLSMRFK